MFATGGGREADQGTLVFGRAMRLILIERVTERPVTDRSSGPELD